MARVGEFYSPTTFEIVRGIGVECRGMNPMLLWEVSEEEQALLFPRLVCDLSGGHRVGFELKGPPIAQLTALTDWIREETIGDWDLMLAFYWLHKKVWDVEFKFAEESDAIKFKLTHL